MLKTRDRTDYFHDFIAMGDDELKRRYAEAETVDDIIFYGHLLQQKKSFGLDYNDLIILTLHLFDTCPEVRRAWQERMEYVMVDEFQDIDGLQYALMEALAGHHGNLFVVGDPDQTIYTWRGANVRYLTEFDAHFHGTRTIIMLENYRSVPQVLSAANSLIARNRQRIAKDLLARRTDAGPAVWYHGADSPAEAAWIAEGVRALHGAGVAYGDIAVLYRAHYASRAVEEAFIREQIPHTVYSGTPFFARREVKDALSYLRLIATKNDLDFRRVANVPKRNLGRRRMKYLEEAAEREGTTLYEALEAHIGDDIFKGTGAANFLKLVETFSATYAERPVSAVLADLLQASGYERLLRSPMPPEYLAQAREAQAAADLRLAERAAAAQFSAGERVAHPVFGKGTVQGVDMTKRAYVVAFDDLETSRAISFHDAHVDVVDKPRLIGLERIKPSEHQLLIHALERILWADVRKSHGMTRILS